MNNEKIISIKEYKSKKHNKMLLFVIALGIIFGLLSWHYFVENAAKLDIKIPESKNITYNDQTPQAISTENIASEFEQNDGKPILLYIYTTWCPSCKKNFANFNEIAREFQNTDLHIIAIAIDRDINQNILQNELNQLGNIYFQPQFLAFKDGFIDFLKQKGLKYEGRIPFTALISRQGEVVLKYNGTRNKDYLRNKLIKELHL